MSTTEPVNYRDWMVRAAIFKHPEEPRTVEALAQYLPSDFDLGDDDLAPYQEGADIVFENETPPVTIRENGRTKLLDPEAAARRNTPPAKDDSKPGVKAEADEPAAPLPPDPDAIEAAVKRRLKADQDLANRRVELIAAQTAERAARAELAQAVTTFQRGFPPMTPEQLRREHVREQAEIRAAIKDGRLSPRQNRGMGKSIVDRQAYFSRGGNPAAGDYRRGAFSSSMRGRSNYDPRRGFVAAKPPGV